MQSMRWSRVFMAGGAALGAAALYNAFSRRGVGSVSSVLPGDEEWFLWRGRRVFYTRHGDGPPLLLLHSIHAAASSYEWRHNVEPLAAGNAVYALDLLGFGRSDRPDARYTAQMYMRLIDDFARLVIGEPVVLVGSSLSGAYAVTLGAQDPASYPGVVAIGPTGLSTLSEPGRKLTPARVVAVTPVVGTTVFNALVSRRSLRHYLERIYRDDSRVTNEMIDAYYTTSHQPGAQHAPAAFIGGSLNVDVAPAVRRLRQPLLLVWGEQASEVPVEDAHRFRTLKRDVEIAIFDPSGDLPHDEQADGFNELVAQFAARVFSEAETT
jgi:pimeloyl-ACP methyl ester carboxylesterase